MRLLVLKNVMHSQFLGAFSVTLSMLRVKVLLLLEFLKILYLRKTFQLFLDFLCIFAHIVSKALLSISFFSLCSNVNFQVLK